jgi:hypothetical protein
VREIWIIDRDTKRPEVLQLTGGEYQAVDPAADGWIRSGVADVEMRPSREGKLEIRLAGRNDTLARLP